MAASAPSSIHVLDASALLCLLFNEPGASKVEACLAHGLISAVNYHEVLASLIDRGITTEEVQCMLEKLDIEVVPFDRAQAHIGAALRPLTHGAGLSLGDRSCLALAWTNKAIALTADPVWAALDLGIRIEVVN